jgi:hypothetical protein
MTTKEKSTASRRNAAHSTGPKTPAGKAASSMNALKHGLRSQKIIVRGEDPAQFNQLYANLQDQYQPQNQTEQNLVELAAIAQWKLVRAEVFEGRCYDAVADPMEQAAIFNRMNQAQCRLERSYLKAYEALERIKAGRQPAPEPPKPEQPKPKPPAQPQQKTDEYYRQQYPGLKMHWTNPSNGITEVWVDNAHPENEFQPESAPKPPNPRAPDTSI